jgi:hypothetical protein
MRIEEASMKQYQNQTFDQKKGSADQVATGQKQGMPGGQIGRGSMGASRGGNVDSGGPEGNSRERKSPRNGSDSNES